MKKCRHMWNAIPLATESFMSLGGERPSGGICGRAHHGRRVCGRFPFHSPLQVREAFDIRGQELWGFANL